ncbi:hypothetical protein B0T16DRAFT_407784 [Cercophora newfieldiana]|uniref:N-acetyltransferase domain-containing protein n=1 Tax=Cercophora newfieldiana TaxID=92897 RepID=A0AA40CRN2_9PEZI|nr:hypothetical protein B0T16DRAFT_407784 [Cercophora newfieldiana]
MPPADPSQNPLTLTPINLHEPLQFAELQRQRVLCGWNYSTSVIESWRADNDAHIQSMFWIVPATLAHLPPPQCYAGHIAMAKKTYSNENGIDAVLPSLTTMDLKALFILPAYRGGGLAKVAVREVEKMAEVEPYGCPECKAMTLNTLARRYVEEDELRAVAEVAHRLEGTELPKKGMSNEDWYARMGYVKWKEVELYPARDGEGKEFKFGASFMWKALG